jgi:hypothetical protein
MSARALGGCYLGLWTATLAGTALTLAGAHVWHAPAPRPALDATPRVVGELMANNTPVALWPLALIALGWPALTGARLAGDALVTAQLLGHGLLVGAAVGQHPGLWRYLPHLPLEWLALAIPAAAWHTARRRARPTPPATPPVAAVRRLGPLAGAALALLALAAAIETYLTPIR